MESFKPFLIRVVWYAVLLATALTLTFSMLIIGLIYLAQALADTLQFWLTPVATHLVTGLVCVVPAILLILVLHRVSRPQKTSQEAQASNYLRILVRDNPWESVGVAFLLGFSHSNAGAEGAINARNVLNALRELRQEAGHKTVNTEHPGTKP